MVSYLDTQWYMSYIVILTTCLEVSEEHYKVSPTFADIV